MQTASNAFKDVPVPMAVWPIVTEFYADEVWVLTLLVFTARSTLEISTFLV